jgi:ubiquitin C-terminal hydrolase
MQDQIWEGTFDCASCGQKRQRTQIQRIDGAPDLLRIKLANILPSGARNDNCITLDPQLDLGQYAAVAAFPAPLKYRLKSVLSHSGSMGLGHWTATAVDPQQVNYINDDYVRPETQAYLSSNPHDGRQAIVLIYTRIETRGG